MRYSKCLTCVVDVVGWLTTRGAKRCLPLVAIFVLFQSDLLAAQYHVAKDGDNRNAGSAGAPFLTIQAAAEQAGPGDTITVHEGIYREEVAPPRGGTSDKKRIVYQAAKGENVEIRGSEVVSEWKLVRDAVWKAEIPNSLFGDFNPFADEISGVRSDWFKPRGRKHHTGSVYYNGVGLFEAAAYDDLFDETGDRKNEQPHINMAWFAEVGDEKTSVYANFGGNDPRDATVEVNVRQTVFYPRKPFVNYITVRGFKLKHAAPKWAPPTAEQMGLIGTHWSKGWIIEDNEISYSINAGISLGKYGDKFDNITTRINRAGEKPDFLTPEQLKFYSNGAKAYLDAIDRARNEMNWNKDHVGSHIVRNNEIHHCEQVGIVGSMGASFSSIIGNEIHHIHMQRRFAGAEMAGIKFHAPVDTLIEGNYIHDVIGGGIWLDWMTQGTRVTRNLVYNTGIIFLEVNHGPCVLDNNLFFAKVVNRSNGMAFAHNLFQEEYHAWLDIRRATPYFKPHSTEKIADHKIDIGDAYFYNNMFVGSGENLPFVKKEDRGDLLVEGFGLHVYEPMPVAPETGGDVYLNGAQPHSNETAVVVGSNPQLELEEKDGQVFVHITIDEDQLASKSPLVTTDLLGKAEVPQQKFTHPDGTPLVIDTDYFGNPRNPANPTAGPFEGLKAGTHKLKVWPVDM